MLKKFKMTFKSHFSIQESYTHMKNLYEALKLFIQILLYSAFRLSVACSARTAMATALKHWFPRVAVPQSGGRNVTVKDQVCSCAIMVLCCNQKSVQSYLYFLFFPRETIITTELRCLFCEKQKINIMLHWLLGPAKNHYGARAYLVFLGYLHSHITTARLRYR